MDRFILSLDEGTTSARAIIFDRESNVLGVGQYEFPQHYPRPGWVEHDPNEIWEAQFRAIKTAIERAKIEPTQIAAIGVTNQRETTIVWDKSGKPLHNAIVWQCRRTAEMVEEIKREYSEVIKEKTGLVPDAYFSASKLKWLLDNVPGLREKAEKGEVLFGTVDTFLIYRLTGEHVTDYSNASRTMLFNIKKLEWDDELLEIFGVPEGVLPEVKESSEIYGYTKKELLGAEIPVSGDAGDQQAALFGQAAFETGMVKATYGTGNFILANTGKTVRYSDNLLTTVAWGLNGKVSYALEGSVFITGAAVQWLRDGIKIIKSAPETEELARKLQSNEGVYFVPAFVGLGAPYWDQFARGLIIGITRGTGREHLARATLEAIAYLTRDVVEEMERLVGIKELRVDGGATANDFLMQFQADILNRRVVRPVVKETTALGAAYLAGLAVDYWEGLEEIKSLWKAEKVFGPVMDEETRRKLYRGWKEAVKRAMGWAKVVDA
ncbi:glycerol kinase [Thermococcus onnurineus NA1]|uniref:Glycerol kinase n=1 Tax=Thermococcus onnurineus (strain NA1) TaxID=523850 RepID=GLPK_THEON|nr:glycerol kinase GlpK [Thermococcus onnurineus]B6YT00.1 RecName: Full=Glycerol kinase; AltName: Full=ATP:glycerol 3-phosphotransferase; AltName: Full=Glycerokinase; Short=GK [Thermococcus onnurineus NA1]ACJ15687.1 glycerol kinase [Thermococcus onnurineus NA1]